MKHLVLIQYKFNPNSKEIVYAVETFKKYAQFDYDMYLLGDKCPWLDIPTIEGDHTNLEKYPCRAQHIRVARDLWKACNIFKEQYGEFCLMSDDFFCLNDFTWEDICVPKYQKEQIRTVNPYSPRVWAYAKWKTCQFLRKQNMPTVDFTTHCFAVYNIEKIMGLIQKYKLTEPNNDYTIEDLYGNTYWKTAEDIANWRLRIARLATPVGCIKQAKEHGLKWLNFSETVDLQDLLDGVKKFCLDGVDPNKPDSSLTTSKSNVNSFVDNEEKTSLMSKKYNGEKGIISLTSWKARIEYVYKTINNLYEMCPDFHICLTLSTEEFPEKKLPQSLVEIQNKFEVIWCDKNYKKHKKIAFALRKYPELPVISADDDCLYTCNYADELWQEWSRTKHQVIRYTPNKRLTTQGQCTLYYNIDFPVETLTAKDIEGNDDDWYAQYVNSKGIKIYALNNTRLPCKFHDDILPFSPNQRQRPFYKRCFE